MVLFRTGWGIRLNDNHEGHPAKLTSFIAGHAPFTKKGCTKSSSTYSSYIFIFADDKSRINCTIMPYAHLHLGRKQSVINLSN
jgi:hypothetical protein